MYLHGYLPLQASQASEWKKPSLSTRQDAPFVVIFHVFVRKKNSDRRKIRYSITHNRAAHLCKKNQRGGFLDSRGICLIFLLMLLSIISPFYWFSLPEQGFYCK